MHSNTTTSLAPITSRHSSHVNDCRAYSGTRIDSDHRLVIAAFKEKLSKLRHKSTNLIKTDIQSHPSQQSIELHQNEIHKLYKNSRDFSTKNTKQMDKFNEHFNYCCRGVNTHK